MTKPVFTYGRFDHGKKFMKYAKPPRATTRQRGTSHMVVTVQTGDYKGESMPVPMHDLGKGLSYKIWKWFVKCGLIVVAILAILHLESIH